MSYPQYSFLWEEDGAGGVTGALTEEDEALLASILSPSSLPLPGEPGSGVWRTPVPPPTLPPANNNNNTNINNNTSKIEFGEGLSDVFESLGVSDCSVASTPSSQQPQKPRPTPLSATSSPFVPSSIPPLPVSQTIPIPLPSLPHHHPQTIHINNFTANLNYHGLSQETQYANVPQQQLYQPQYQQQHQDAAHLMHQQKQQQQAVFQHQVYQQQAAYQPAIFPAGFQQPMVGGPLMFVQVPVSASYQQGRPVEEEGPPRFTFGSTPVVSVRTHAVSTSETDVEEEAGGRQYGGGGGGPLPASVNQPLPQVQPPATHSAQVSEHKLKPEGSKSQICNSEHPSAKIPINVEPAQPIVHQPGTSRATAGGQPDTSAVQSSPPSKTVQQPPQVPQQKVPPVQNVPPVTTQAATSPHTQSVVSKTQPQTACAEGSIKEQQDSTIPPPAPKSSNRSDSEPLGDEKLTSVVVQPVESAQNSLPTVSQPPSKSWASLFSGKGGSEDVSESGTSKPMAVISPFSPSLQPVSPPQGDLGVVTGGNANRSLGVFLRDYPLKHSSNALVPRGLTNRSNWCFVNAIMQALLACPPLYNLIRTLAMDPAMATNTGRVSTPMLDSVSKFMSEFSVLEPVMGTRAQKKDKSKRRNDIVTGVGLEPTCIYNMLLGLQEDTFKVVEGRQEDAEEFLTCLLNGLSDEMQELIKLADDQEKEVEEEDVEEEQQEGDWQEVGAKGKSCVTRRVAGTDNLVTPMQALALGMCRSCVKVEGKDSSATLQPFYTLQLDIQDRDIQSVTDALLTNFASEKLDGFVCGKTKQEVEATRSLSLEELPPVLILHLKRFVYDAATGGVQKIMKPVDFSVDLEINKSILSAECRSTTTAKHRQYKLFSVVCHNGREATKGHYVTDVFHTGYSTWLHCDDGIVQPTAEELVVAPGSNSTPYILFYRRGDTLVGMDRKEQ